MKNTIKIKTKTKTYKKNKVKTTLKQMYEYNGV